MFSNGLGLSTSTGIAVHVAWQLRQEISMFSNGLEIAAALGTQRRVAMLRQEGV